MLSSLAPRNTVPLNPVAHHIVEMAKRAEEERLRRMKRATEAYYGQLPKVLLPKPGKPDDNIQLNYGRLFVNKGASFLFGKELKFQIDETQTTPEEEYLDKVWKKNKKMSLLHNLGINGGMYGHVFVQTLIQEQPGQLINGKKYIRLVNVDPQTVNVRWAMNDIEKIEWYHISSPAINKDGKPVTHRQRIERVNPDDDQSDWITIEEEKGFEEDGKSEQNTERWVELSRTPWPYPFPPIAHCQNLPAPNEFWGIADLEDDTIDLIQAINFVVSNTRKIYRYHGHPKTIGKGFQAGQVDFDTDKLVVLPNPQATIDNLEMHGNLSDGLNFFKELKEALFVEGRIPEIAIGNMQGVGALSGVALEILYQPLLDKNESKRMLYGDMLEVLCARMLVIAGFRSNVNDIDVNITWPSALPRDMMEERQALQIDKELGVVSDETIATKLQYDYKTEMQKKQAEAEEKQKLAQKFGLPQQQQGPPQNTGAGGDQQNQPPQRSGALDEQ